MLNIALALRVIEHAAAHPEQLDMRATVRLEHGQVASACLAGRALLLSGYMPLPTGLWQAPGGRFTVSALDGARDLLGLDDIEVFGRDLTRGQALAMLNSIVDGELDRMASPSREEPSGADDPGC